MLKSERRKITFREFDSYFKPLGYKSFKTGGDPTYLMKTDTIVVKFFMNFLDAQSIDISDMRISILEIENYIIEIFGREYISKKYFYDEKKYFLTTVFDGTFENIYDYKELNTEEEILEFTKWYINYYENEGKHFIETYSYLPNILKRMDELMETKGYWSDILTGGVPHLFKGLIISKLCNDPNFNNKVSFVDNLFATKDISKFLPYYEKLKERLKTIEPIYNV
ncbi:hypothetical protein KRX57_04845 [Weeksellaceae bacterium TAE3-ERU29]|nr:hypothetical protein [Weeksellaceae bacterium TAE3-ERU29]